MPPRLACSLCLVIDFVERAREFVRLSYARAEAAFLGGSAATGDGTESSDLDILIVLGGDSQDTAFVETTTTCGQLVEAFVYGGSGLQVWLDKGRVERRPVLDRLIGEGVGLTDSDEENRLAQRSQQALAAGPAALQPDELQRRAYALSSLLDDLNDADDQGVKYVVGAALWQEAAELALLSDGRWLGTGKWLLRELHRGPDRWGLIAWAEDECRDAETLIRSARSLLDANGGYLQAGVVRGDRPADL